MVTCAEGHAGIYDEAYSFRPLVLPGWNDGESLPHIDGLESLLPRLIPVPLREVNILEGEGCLKPRLSESLLEVCQALKETLNAGNVREVSNERTFSIDHAETAHFG